MSFKLPTGYDSSLFSSPFPSPSLSLCPSRPRPRSRPNPRPFSPYRFLPLVESFNDGGSGECRKFIPVLGGDGTKIAPPGDIFDQPPGETSLLRGKLADHVEDHALLSPEEAVLVTPGTESSYPLPPIVERLVPGARFSPWYHIIGQTPGHARPKLLATCRRHVLFTKMMPRTEW